MAENPELHKRLINNQSIEELKRKADKAVNKANLWTQEELDLAKREAKELVRFLSMD